MWQLINPVPLFRRSEHVIFVKFRQHFLRIPLASDPFHWVPIGSLHSDSGSFCRMSPGKITVENVSEVARIPLRRSMPRSGCKRIVRTQWSRSVPIRTGRNYSTKLAQDPCTRQWSELMGSDRLVMTRESLKSMLCEMKLDHKSWKLKNQRGNCSLYLALLSSPSPSNMKRTNCV